MTCKRVHRCFSLIVRKHSFERVADRVSSPSSLARCFFCLEMLKLVRLSSAIIPDVLGVSIWTSHLCPSPSSAVSSIRTSTCGYGIRWPASNIKLFSRPACSMSRPACCLELLVLQSVGSRQSYRTHLYLSQLSELELQAISRYVCHGNAHASDPSPHDLNNVFRLKA